MPINSSRHVAFHCCRLLHSSIVRIFTLWMVGSWLSRVILKPLSVALTAEAICAVALVFAIMVTLFILKEYS